MRQLNRVTNRPHYTVSEEQRVSFTKVIDSILSASDINTISSKRIRQGLQATVNYDLNDYKVGLAPIHRYDMRYA